ncbi:MAG TPA: hypothetical protein VGN57_07865 [Pirellulaceae bacterium]|jgi:hypothetical protein|nr:hypothetical protein [Pirellulaceae bacterium]
MPATSAFRISIVELLLLILVPGLGIAAIRAGGVAVTIALLVGMMWFIVMAVAASFGRDGLRRFAGGFVVAGAIYGGLVFYFGPTELDLDGRLPTTQALKPLNESMTTTMYTNMVTHKSITEAEVKAIRRSPTGGPAVEVTLWPDRAEFMAVSHLLIGLLIGYLGGKLAVAIGRSSRPDIGLPSTG